MRDSKEMSIGTRGPDGRRQREPKREPNWREALETAHDNLQRMQSAV